MKIIWRIGDFFAIIKCLLWHSIKIHNILLLNNNILAQAAVSHWSTPNTLIDSLENFFTNTFFHSCVNRVYIWRKFQYDTENDDKFDERKGGKYSQFWLKASFSSNLLSVQTIKPIRFIDVCCFFYLVLSTFLIS